jgi:phage replication-related protein YjqB (UPF0714/DUF867 family)
MGSHRDVFPDVPALKSQLKDKRDYRIRARDRGAFATIVSPHGGYIEEGTSALARACAGPDFNFFDFQGLRTKEPQELHVTSTRFREPALMTMLAASEVAVSIHGMGEEDDMTIWLGGLNKELKESMLKALREQGFLVNPDSPRHRGESKLNFVNMAKQKGVQLELPNNLLKTMFVGPRKFAANGRCIKTTPVFDKFVKAVRQVVHAEKRRHKKLNAAELSNK